MGNLVQYVTPLHQATSRAYIDRMVDDKVHCMLKAKEYTKLIIGMETGVIPLIMVLYHVE